MAQHMGFICLYTDQVGQLILMQVASCLLRFVITPYLYQVSLTAEIFFSDCFYIMFLLFINILLAILVLYIASLHDKMRLTIV